MDLISRDAAIAAIETARQAFALPDDVPGSRLVNAGFAAARGAVEGVPSGWVSVKDRLPENGVRVLTYTGNDPNMEIGWYHSFGRNTLLGGDIYVFQSVNNKNERFFINDVTHWQALPTPPAE